MPWDVEEKLNQNHPPLLLDIRESYEFFAMHIKGSMNVPRGILESACDYNYSETEPSLVNDRKQEIIVICRSGNRSVLAASTMQQMGFSNVSSLKTGLKGWNDFDQLLIDQNGNKVNAEQAEAYLSPDVKPEQTAPK